MYIDLNKNQFCYDDECCEGAYCGEVYAASETSGAAMRKKKRLGKESAELLATDGDWELWTPTTWESAIYLASVGGDQKAQWAFAYSGDSHWFDAYNSRGPIYIFINKANPVEKYAYHPNTNSFYDQYDHMVDFDTFICEHPTFAEFFDAECDDVEACGDINASTDIEAAKMPSRYQSVRDILGEDEWYYIEDYLMNGDGEYSLDDILYDMDAWDHYADWKMQTYHKKPVISASTRIRARRAIMAATDVYADSEGFVPDFTGVTSVGKGEYRGDTSLTELDLSSVTFIGSSAFRDCTNLSHITLNPDAVIQAYAFYGCTNLTGEIHILPTMFVSAGVFDNCPNLTVVWEGSDDRYRFNNIGTLVCPADCTKLIRTNDGDVDIEIM